MKHVLWRLGIPFPGRGLAFLSVFVVFSSRAEVVSVDVAEWPSTNETVTASGWTVHGISAYKEDGGVTFDAVGDYAISPVYPGCVTQLVLRVCSTQPDLQRNLTARPESADPAARTWTMDCTPEQKFAEQSFFWDSSEQVRRFRFQIAGKQTGNWHVHSLDVYVDRVEAPQDLREETVYSDALSVAWMPDQRAVSNEVELCLINTVPSEYDLLEDWDFTSLTNTSGNATKYFVSPSDFSPALTNVEGVLLNLQKKAGGHIQIGNTDWPGLLALTLPEGVDRQAVIRLYRYEKDGAFPTHVECTDSGGMTNELVQITLGTSPTTEVVEIPDDAAELVIWCEKKNNRIRVEDVKIVTDYVPGYETTNEVACCRTVRNARTIKALAPGDYIWRVRSFDAEGTESVWSPYRKVTLSADDPKRPVPGLAVVIR